MSDIDIQVPAWVVALAFLVQVTPLLLIAAAALFMRGLLRYLAIGAFAFFAFELIAAGVLGWLRPRYESVAPDPNQITIPPSVIAQLGLQADRAQRTVDGGWAVHLTRPQAVDGWTCLPDLVELTLDGHLRRCALASAHDWNGWPLPPLTLVTPGEGTLGIVVPPDAPVMAPEIGRPLPATGGMTLNADGSLDSVYFDAEAPLLVCGRPLWSTVRWRYDAATLGQGRTRPPAAVTGASLSGNPVEIPRPGCAK